MSAHPPHRAHAITVLNLKGGVGKTHTSWLLASVCQERGKRILLIDTDTQGNLSNSFVRERDGKPGIEVLLNPALDCEARDLILRTSYPQIDLIPSSSKLATFDLSNQVEWERQDLHRSFIDPIESLRPLYDYIVFDCPPRLSLASFAALCASDAVIVPLEAADWGAQGIMQVTAAVEYVQHSFNRRLELLGYLISRFKPRRAYQQAYLRQLREHFGERTFDTVLPDLSAFERAVTDAIPITLHAPQSSAATIARQFFDEVESRIEKLVCVSDGSRKAGVSRNAEPALRA
ncbi:MAG: hypothetical protein JWM11_5072 [Planctomycetaceae bacterium]|nr:hypothetical protein [Planctomycetaceae bacterium]